LASDMPRRSGNDNMPLDGDASVGVIGGGPAGSFFAYFLLLFAERAGIRIAVTVYEPRDFEQPAPKGCNMCGGIISESLVQMLAAEGIDLPSQVVQRGIDSYVLHMDIGSVRIDTPIHEMRIAAVHRGAGPRDIKERKWRSMDGFLLSLASERGATVIRERVDRVRRDEEGLLNVELRSGAIRTHALVAVATGVNSGAKLWEGLEMGYTPPRVGKAYIREYFLGEEGLTQSLGSSLHVFLPDLPEVEFAAIIPKGDYATLCLLGDGIDKDIVRKFLDTPWVRDHLPPETAREASCFCSPKLSLSAAVRPFADRLVFIGDCGVTRLYKDGVGAAYRTAKAAARTAVFDGVSEAAFREHYWPSCRRIDRDNQLGRFIFRVTRGLQKTRRGRAAILRMVADEQRKDGGWRRMSLVLWNVFTGSEPYRQILLRTVHPAFVASLGRYFTRAMIHSDQGWR
jgi:flavin-dependent dehydrogenase